MSNLTEQEAARLRLKAKHGVLEPHEEALWVEYQNQVAYDKGAAIREREAKVVSENDNCEIIYSYRNI